MPASSRVQLFDKDLLRLWLDTPSDPANIFGIHHPDPNDPPSSPGALLHQDGHIIGLDLHLKHHRQQWRSLTQYRTCTLRTETIAAGDCVLVRHDSVEREYHSRPDTDPSLSFWKAVVLEIRALDSEHVYVLLSWFDRPLDDGRSPPEGYKWGKYELVASTEVDIVTAKAVQSRFEVGWEKKKGRRYYWRMAWDFVGQKTVMPDKVHPLCSCGESDEDKPVVKCEACRRWMHIHCAMECGRAKDDCAAGAAETRRDSAVAGAMSKSVSRDNTPGSTTRETGICVHCRCAMKLSS